MVILANHHLLRMYTRNLLRYGQLMLQLLLRLVLRTLMRALLISRTTGLASLLELTNLASDLFQGIETLMRLVEQMRRFYQLISIGK